MNSIPIEKQSALRSSSTTAILVIGIMLVAANLRPSILGLGPLVETISAQIGLSNTMTGVLSSIPLFAFALISPLAPKLARRIGMEWTLMGSLVLLAVGILVRSASAVAFLFIGTLFIGIAIAVGNVLLPGLIKRDFPNAIGSMTGSYVLAMSIFGALAAGISFPLSAQAGLGWRGSLASWALLAAVAIVFWLPQLRNRHVAVSAAFGESSIWRSRLAWQVSLFMGLQSFMFYVTMTWLPVILHERGLSIAGAGWMVSAVQFISLPVSFIVPIIAGRRPDQRSIVIITIFFYLVGYVGLLFGGGMLLTWIWVIAVGIAGGSSISLALAFFGLRAHNARQAAELSGMAQFIGYLLATLGPILFGYMHDATHSWFLSLLTLVVTSVLLLFVGLPSGRNAYVTQAE